MTHENALTKNINTSPHPLRPITFKISDFDTRMDWIGSQLCLAIESSFYTAIFTLKCMYLSIFEALRWRTNGSLRILSSVCVFFGVLIFDFGQSLVPNSTKNYVTTDFDLV